MTADVFLTRRCNNACPYCTYARYEKRNGPEMPEANFDAMLDRLVEFGVKGVILTGGGEPTFASVFEHACGRLDDIQMPYGINTNFNIYKECKPRYLKVSLDGWDETSYEKARGVKAYNRVVENIQRYCEWKSEFSPNTNVGIQIVAKTRDDAIEFWSANRHLPVDYIVFRPVESVACSYYSTKELFEANKMVALLEGLKNFDDRIVINPKFKQLGIIPKKCSANRLQIAVDERCNVIYCCHKPYEVVGSIFDDNILDKLDAWRTNVAMCDTPCRLTSSNLYIDEIEQLYLCSDNMFI